MKYYFFSGFEVGDSFNFTSASGGVGTSVVKKGNYSGENQDNENFRKVLATGLTTVYMSGWFRWSVDIGNNWFVFVGEGTSNTQFEVKTNNGHLKVYINANGVTYTETVTNLVKDTWYFIEFKFVLHDSAGLFELKVNGESVLSQSNIDTKNVDSAITTFKWQGINAAGYCYVDECGLSDNFPSNYEQVIGVSKTGIDIKSASVHQLKFGSSFNTLKIRQSQYNSITTDGDGNGSATINHGLSYKPAFMSFAHMVTTYTVDGVSFSNAIFPAGSAHFCPFYYDTSGINQSLRDILITSDTNNINLIINGPAGKNYKLYTYIFSDIAEETSQAKTFTGNDYGLRISQPGYDVKTDPDYRMIFTSKDSVFHIAKTGTISFTIDDETINDGDESLQYKSVTFASLGISDGYHPFMLMLPNWDISGETVIEQLFSVVSNYDTQYLPWLPFSGLPEAVSHAGAFCTNDRIIFYCWRSYVDMGSGGSRNFASCDSEFFVMRYMIFNETMTFS